MDKQTIINDLVARIPYGVVVNCTDGDVQLISVDFEMGYDNPEFWHDGPGSNINFDDDNIKPYLFPLSSMTEEQKKEYKHLVAFSGSPNGAANFIDWLTNFDCSYDTRNCQVQHLDYKNGHSSRAMLVSSDRRSLGWIKETIENKVYDVKEKIRLTLMEI